MSLLFHGCALPIKSWWSLRGQDLGSFTPLCAPQCLVILDTLSVCYDSQLKLQFNKMLTKPKEILHWKISGITDKKGSLGEMFLTLQFHKDNLKLPPAGQLIHWVINLFLCQTNMTWDALTSLTNWALILGDRDWRNHPYSAPGWGEQGGKLVQ
jgi:hypothetical protein